MQFDQHQMNAVSRLKSGSILVGGTGSGKSRTALVYYFTKECGGSLELSNRGTYSPMKQPRDLYIITTAAKRDKMEWEQELIPFMLKKGQNKSVNVIIDSWNNIKKYTNACGAFFIFDEQRVVGSGAWAKSFIQISKKNHWILLSATPGDTWSDYIPVFIANGFYKNRTEFVRRHIVYSRFTDYPKIERYLEVGRLERLRSIILIDMKVEKRTTPHRVIVPVNYDEEKYNVIIKDRWNFYEDKPVENASQYTYLSRKVVNSSEDRKEKIKDILKENPKAIIFYSFDYELDILREIAKEMNIYCAEWNGHKHMPVPTYDNWVYLVQYNSGSEGWECISTNVIIFYSLSHSYRMTHQAAGRIDRRNTSYSDLYYYYLKSQAGIDVSIMRCLNSKKDFNESRFFLENTAFAKNTLPLIGEEGVE